MVEHSTVNRGAIGSNPISGDCLFIVLIVFVGKRRFILKIKITKMPRKHSLMVEYWSCKPRVWVRFPLFPGFWVSLKIIVIFNPKIK